MTIATWAAGSVVERAFTYRGHDRYAHLGLRVAPDEGDFGIKLCDATCDDPEWPIYREGLIDGLRRAAAAGLYRATITVTEVRIHPVDTRRGAFAMAAARCLNVAVAEVTRVPRGVPEGVLPRVTTTGRAAVEAALRAADPTEAASVLPPVRVRSLVTRPHLLSHSPAHGADVTEDTSEHRRG